MKIYLVGGAVRDELLGIPVQERDYLVVGGTERQLLAQGFRRLDQAFPVFVHPQTGDEYALARRERKTGPGYKGFAVEAGPDVTLEQDLARRDFTVNALAREDSGRVIDLFGGRDDLEAGRLRHITDAFVEDPVRLLRAARFTAKLGRWGFALAHGTFGLLKRMARADELQTVMPDRFREEMTKALGTDQPWRFFQTLQRCGAQQRLLPELETAIPGGEGHGSGALPAHLAALQRASRASRDPAVRLTALFAAALPNAAAGRRLGDRLRLDGDSRRMLAWAQTWPPRRLSESGAGGLLGLLEQLGTRHHPERLERLALVWRAVQPEAGAVAAGVAALARAADAGVGAKPLQAAGWSGPGLGQELRRLRLAAIDAALKGNQAPVRQSADFDA
jgi:tRNA nucleotidyltransferase (CCA-adding enzyme)